MTDYSAECARQGFAKIDAAPLQNHEAGDHFRRDAEDAILLDAFSPSAGLWTKFSSTIRPLLTGEIARRAMYRAAGVNPSTGAACRFRVTIQQDGTAPARITGSSVRAY